jgi:hypothetical protein
MRTLIFRSLLAAVLIGVPATFASTVLSTRVTVRYEPGISEAEMKAYDDRPVSELTALLKSRSVKFSRSQWLRESVGEMYFWQDISLKSVVPCVGIFLGCLVVGLLERRDATTSIGRSS